MENEILIHFTFVT